MRPSRLVVAASLTVVLTTCRAGSGVAPEDGSLEDDAAAPTADAPAVDSNPSAPDAPNTVDAPTSSPRDVTFFVVADTHADPPQSYDLRAIARVINTVPTNGTWPASINGHTTNFVGGPITAPTGVVFVGDITGWGTAPLEIPTFRRYFQAGASGEAIQFPGYVGLGNHDVDNADRPPALGETYRNNYWAMVDERHKGPSAPVPVTAPGTACPRASRS
jgi:cytolysin (calcineurin-like family phosphatase)